MQEAALDILEIRFWADPITPMLVDMNVHPITERRNHIRLHLGVFSVEPLTRFVQTATVRPGAMQFNDMHYDMSARLICSRGAWDYERTSAGAVSSHSIEYYGKTPPAKDRESIRLAIHTEFTSYLAKHGARIMEMFKCEAQLRCAQHSDQIQVLLDKNLYLAKAFSFGGYVG